MYLRMSDLPYTTLPILSSRKFFVLGDIFFTGTLNCVQYQCRWGYTLSNDISKTNLWEEMINREKEKECLEKGVKGENRKRSEEEGREEERRGEGRRGEERRGEERRGEERRGKRRRWRR